MSVDERITTILVDTCAFRDPSKYPKGTFDKNYYSEIWIHVKKNKRAAGLING